MDPKFKASPKLYAEPLLSHHSFQQIAKNVFTRFIQIKDHVLTQNLAENFRRQPSATNDVCLSITTGNITQLGNKQNLQNFISVLTYSYGRNGAQQHNRNVTLLDNKQQLQHFNGSRTILEDVHLAPQHKRNAHLETIFPAIGSDLYVAFLPCNWVQLGVLFCSVSLLLGMPFDFSLLPCNWGTLHLFANSNFCQLTFTFSDLVAHYLLRHLVNDPSLAGSAGIP